MAKSKPTDDGGVEPQGDERAAPPERTPEQIEAQQILIEANADPIHLMIESMERLARNPDMNPDNLEKMLNMQERILDRNALMEYNRAMVLCQNAIPKVGKDKAGEKANTRYASLENVIDIAGPIWAEHGFALEFFEGDSPEGMVRVCCDVRHIGGHVEHRKIDVPLDDKGPQGTPNKTATQGTGSSFSYGKRYLSCGVFNIATGDDLDGAKPGVGAERIDEEQIDALSKQADRIPDKKAREKQIRWIRSMGFDGWTDISVAKYDEILKQITATADEWADKA